MTTYSEMIEKTKKKETENQGEDWNIIGRIIRRISYPFTYILVKTRITPNQVSFLSLLCTIAGFIFMLFSGSTAMKLEGILMFGLWAVLDCVDGNIARIKQHFSEIGDLWDAAAGYAALFFMFFGMGIGSSGYSHGMAYVIAGGLSGACTLYPRLLMHFKYHGEVNEINDVRNYGLLKKIAFNITSPDAFLILFMLISVVFHIEPVFTGLYFAINLFICLYTCRGLLKGQA